MSALHEIDRGMSLGSMRKVSLRENLRLRGGRRFFGPAAASRTYSRRVAPLKFGAFLPSRRMSRLGSSTQLGERVSMTRSPFLGAFIQTVVNTFGSVGALAVRFLIVNPSSTKRAASPSGSKVEGIPA